jgi:hypothetical protein
MARAELIIEAWVDDYAPLRSPVDIGEWVDDGQHNRVERAAVDDGAVVNGMSLDIQEKRGAPVQWTAPTGSVFLQQKRRLLLRIRVPRIPEVIGEIKVGGAMKFIGTRFGEDLDPAITEFVVFRGERVLIDSDLANGLFGGKLPSTESVHVDGAAARSGGRSGQSFQVGL